MIIILKHLEVYGITEEMNYFQLIALLQRYNNTKIFSVSKKIKKIYCVICGKCRKFDKPKTLYLLGQ